MNKIFKRKLWGALALVFASFFVVLFGGYQIADSQSATINSSLKSQTFTVDYSDDPQYDYFGGNFQKGTYTGTYEDVKATFNAVAEEAESEGLVLLRNENKTLPLSKGEKVSTLLSGSYNLSYGTSGSGASSAGEYKTFKKALEDVGLDVSEEVWNYYADVTGRNSALINDASFDSMGDGVKAALEGTTALVVVSRSMGEGNDAPAANSDGHDGSYLSLSNNELSVLHGLTALKNQNKVKKIIVVLNTSATMQLDFLDGLVTANGTEYNIDVDACMWVGNVGSAGIDAVTKTLVGNYVPSGKLSDTYLKDNFSSPAGMQLLYNSTGRNNFAQLYNGYMEYVGTKINESNMYYGVYTEGIYVGYRYYETRYYDYVTARQNVGDYDYDADVEYAFGYGQSYTAFEYSGLSVTEGADGKSFDVSVTVTNTGREFNGKEVVQIYLQKPYTAYDETHGVEKAAVELVGYAKTGVLYNAAEANDGNKPGSETVTINVSKEKFKSYDAEFAKTYIMDDGDYYFSVGNGAHEAVNNILANQAGDPSCDITVNSDRMSGSSDAMLARKVAVAHKGESFAIATDDAGEKYALSIHENVEGEHAEITNVIDNADPNKYIGKDTVKFVTRSDWAGSMPKSEAVINASDVVDGLQSNLGIKNDPKAETPEYGADNGVSLAELRSKKYNDELWEKLLDQMTYADQTLLIANGYYQTIALDSASVGAPATSAKDGPTGIGDSKGGLSFPCEGIWASTFNAELIEKIGGAFAEEALANGYQNVYAPGVNIHRIAFGGRSHEYFSEDPYLTGMTAISEIKGMQSKGVVATVKHFVFNDEEDQRVGISVWLNEQEAREIMLTAFEYALSPDYGDAGSVMNSFNRAGATWVGAHAELTDMMRNEWGFEGYCMTDMASGPAANYMTFQDGIPAGTNLYLGTGSENALSAYRDNATFCQAMRDACHRILYTVCNYSAAMNNIGPDTYIGVIVEWWRTMLIAFQWGAGVLMAGCAVMYILCIVRAQRKSKRHAAV